MFNAEVTGVTHDKISPRISETAKKLWGTYSALTALLIIMLWIGPMNLFESIVHAFGTISTGGFSTKPDGISGYNSDYITIVITLFMAIGGVNFAILYKAFHGRWTKIRTNDVVKTYIGSIIVFTILFIVSIALHGQSHSWQDVTITPLFQVVSTITSTGYISSNFLAWGPFVLALTFIMMLSGGCAGSTSGGAKIDRLLILRRYINNELHHAVRPNGVFSVRINGAHVSDETVSKVVAFLCLFVLLIVGGGTVMTMMGLAPVDSFFSAFSCICNTGFGASVTGYGENFAIIPNAAKWLLAALMLIGRLEIFTVLAIFSRCFWRR
jgi:trk system potassium uptake protein TrkH